MNATTEMFRMDWNTGKMVPVQETPELERGTKLLYYVGQPSNITRTYAVLDGKQRRMVLIPAFIPEKEEDVDTEGISFERTYDKFIDPIEKAFGIGIYYCLNEPRFSEDELQEAMKYAEWCKSIQEKRKEEKRLATERKIESLKKEYSYLTMNPKTARERTDNVRKVLKKHFPGVKFSVRYDSFSGGDSCDVRYEDGPLYEDVAKYVRMFQDSHADFTGDYWDYDPSEFNKLFGGFKFTHTERKWSNSVREKYLAEVADDYPKSWDGTEIHESKFWLCYKLAHKDANFKGCWISYEALALHRFRENDHTPVQKQPERQVSEPKSDGLQIVDYSDRAFAITGDTKPISGLLRELGGRFNARLSCGAGWIFSKRKEQEVRLALSL
ncbi:MAG: hypothetical protein IJ271_00970 [Bacteroidales bacterium]|nr:hypothetical protein [Bacteroidales bacterium]